MAATTSRDWNVDDVITFGTYCKGKSVKINEELDLIGGDSHENEYEEQYTIISIDEDSKLTLVNQSTHYGSHGTYSFDYDGMEMAQTKLTPASFFSAHYFFDEASDSVLLAYSDFEIYFWKFIEVDWAEFNNHFEGVFDDTNVIDSIDTPSGEIEITVSEFLESISYTICGQSDIVDARKHFTSTTTEWTMSFDLSGVAHYYNYETEGYVLYKKYKVTTQIEYTPGGTLKNHQITLEYELEIDTQKTEYYYEEIIALGGVNIIPIPTVFTLVCFSVVALAIIIIRKKRRK